jgi:Type VI secretion system/phage-baseplate injector OB domain
VSGGDGRTYFGKYRGRVFNNQDPKGLARIQIQVPDVMGLNVSNWAMPCLPFTGLQSGLYVVPPVNAGVWVEFEQGDIDHPVWTGCWWGGPEEVPTLAQAPVVPPLQNIVLQTVGGHVVAINDQKAGPVSGIVMKTPGGAMIQVSDTGIVITNGTARITLVGNAVSINGTGLVVT